MTAPRAAKANAPPTEIRATRASSGSGTPGEVADRLAEFAAIGAERVYLQVLDLHDLDHLGLIASDVMPQVS